jgi:hypothetical protein
MQARQLPARPAGLAAKVRDLDALAPRDLEDRLAGQARQLAAVEREADGLARGHACSSCAK